MALEKHTIEKELLMAKAVKIEQGRAEEERRMSFTEIEMKIDRLMELEKKREKATRESMEGEEVGLSLHQSQESLIDSLRRC